MRHVDVRVMKGTCLYPGNGIWSHWFIGPFVYGLTGKIKYLCSGAAVVCTTTNHWRHQSMVTHSYDILQKIIDVVTYPDHTLNCIQFH